MSNKSGGTVLVWALALQNPPSSPNEFLMYALADDTDEGAKKVEDALAAAQQGEFVCVPIRFANMADAANVYIQPHRWGLWCVVRRVVEQDELFGGGGSR
jgi:hypothetical protein